MGSLFVWEVRLFVSEVCVRRRACLFGSLEVGWFWLFVFVGWLLGWLFDCVFVCYACLVRSLFLLFLLTCLLACLFHWLIDWFVASRWLACCWLVCLVTVWYVMSYHMEPVVVCIGMVRCATVVILNWAACLG